MLVNFTLSNWRSYRDTATLSMVATRERQHKETLKRVSCLRASILSTAVLFGKNAAGKSNLFQALSFCKWFVTRSTRTPSMQIPVSAFRFNSKSREQPTEFSFSLLIDEVKWDYSFATTTTRVIKESLECSSRRKGCISYTRIYNLETDDYTYTYGSALEEHKGLLDLIAQMTRPNQLFLTTSVYHNTDFFKPVYHWFDTVLRLISPIDTFSRLDLFTDHDQPSVEQFTERLKLFQTGITGIRRKKMDLSRLPIPTEHLEQITQELSEGKVVRISCNGKRLPFVLTKQNGELLAEELVSVHKLNESNVEIDLPLEEESDGTRRILDLLPVFMNLEKTDTCHVYVIDELDRCLHSSATQKLLEDFRASRAECKNSQLLFTTHDLQLMNQTFFRRDEIWIALRNIDLETSQICRFSDIPNLRTDKTLLNCYLDKSFEVTILKGDC